MKKTLACLVTMTLTLGCSSSPSRPEPSQMAYPFGTYRHQVTATPKTAAGLKPIELSGVVQSQQHDLRVVGLSPVGSTVFRIHEDLCEHKITKDFYIEELKKHENHFEALYKIIKAALYARRDRPEFMYHGARISLSEPDAKGIPRKIKVAHPYLDLNIAVTGYEVAK